MVVHLDTCYSVHLLTDNPLNMINFDLIIIMQATVFEMTQLYAFFDFIETEGCMHKIIILQCHF